MNCFQHPETSAVGSCAYCGRGLCHSCATLVEGKLSCRGDCQNEITRERRLITESETAISQRPVALETTSVIYRRSFAMNSFFGLAFLVLGILLIVKDHYVFGGIMATLGGVFLITGSGMASASKKFKEMADNDRNKGMQS